MTQAQPTLTDQGTPRAQAWPLEWFERVNALEHELGRRICGGVCADGHPCRRTSTHSSGRCSHHGGNHLTGAPKGNENARIHGLYSRRLQRCGERCVMWGACPFAEDDLLDIPLSNRPNCVYEQTEYDRLIEHYAGKGEAVDVHLAHTVALLQVMVSRAASALSLDGFTETTRATGADYSMESSKMSAALQAFLRLAREHRQHRRELMREVAAVEDNVADQRPLSLSGRVRPLLKKAEGVIEADLDFERRRLAALEAGEPFSEEEELEREERFYEEHGYYPGKEERDGDEAGEEEGSSDKDARDGQDDWTREEERKEEDGEGEGEEAKGSNTDDADGADYGKEGGPIQQGLSKKGKAEEQEVEGHAGIVAVPP